jgi:RHS repeat-associated protein
VTTVYDGYDPVQEQSPVGTILADVRTGPGVDQRFARTKGAATSRYLTDLLGSTVALTDSAGVVQTTYGYDPYGNTSQSGAANDNQYQFTGRQNDGTGLYYYRARYYNPNWGRFISEDPIGLAGGVDLYAYARGNPASFADPLGLDTYNVGFSGTLNIPLIGPVGPAGGFFGGVATDTNGNWGFYGGVGGGVGAGAGGSFGVQFGGSNAATICELSGPFLSVSASGGEGIIAGYEGYSGQSASGDVNGFNLFIGAGGGTPVSGSYQYTNTWVEPYGGVVR